MRVTPFFRKRKSCNVAKDRLKILLISDRVNCSEKMMEQLKCDIAKVISKYMKIDTKNMDIQISKTSGKGLGNKNPTLFANIPIIEVRDLYE